MDLKRGIFFTEINGEYTDEGIVDSLLINDDEILPELVRLGIVQDMHITKKDLED